VVEIENQLEKRSAAKAAGAVLQPPGQMTSLTGLHITDSLRESCTLGGCSSMSATVATALMMNIKI